VVKVFSGKAKDVSVLTYVISLLFLIKFFAVVEDPYSGIRKSSKEQIDHKHRVSRFKFQTIPVYHNGLPIVIEDGTDFYK